MTSAIKAALSREYFEGIELGVRSEREAIVAWLRAEAAKLKTLAQAQADMRDRTYVFGRMWEIESLAKRIENGNHALQPEAEV